MFCVVKKKEKYIFFFSPNQANAPPPIAIQSKHRKHWTSVYVMVSEAVSGGEIQMFKLKINSGS